MPAPIRIITWCVPQIQRKYSLLEQLQNALRHLVGLRQHCLRGLYQNVVLGVRPVSYTHLDVYKRQSINCIAKFDGARVELYLGSADKERNKRLYDFLHSNQDEIEKQLTRRLIWSRADDRKASRIYFSADNMDVSNENDWPRMAEFHATATAEMRKAFSQMCIRDRCVPPQSEGGTISHKGRMTAIMLLPLETSMPTQFTFTPPIQNLQSETIFLSMSIQATA